MHTAYAIIDWINEIHCWGLSTHGPSCQEDLETMIKEDGFWEVLDA